MNHVYKNLIVFLSGIAVFALTAFTCQKSPEKDDAGSIVCDALNPTDREFPGGRGADQLICYTAVFGERTGTNKYGIEAVVMDSTVILVGGNDNLIPQNGFVLSGHGRMSRWISGHLYPGLKVWMENREVKTAKTDETDLHYAAYFLELAVKQIRGLETGEHVDTSAVGEAIRHTGQQVSEALAASPSVRKSGDGPSPEQLLNTARDLYFRSFPSRPNETRAVWYRLRERSPEELEKTMREMADLGLNVLCPETIYGGYAIYPGAHPDLLQHPDFAGWDPLAEMIRLGKKYRIRVVPWVWVFFIGKETSPLIESKNDWLGLSRAQEHPSRLEKGYYFFCPAREDVHVFWLEVYAGMLRKYDLGGLQLDYIRYPVSLPWDMGFCYCDHCRQAFKTESGFDPLEISPEDNPAAWEQWNSFRTGQVTDFVEKVHTLVGEIKPEVPLSADVFPDVEESIATKCQDWGTWLERGYLDEIFTMSYTPDVETVRREALYLAGRTSTARPGYVGLGPYQGFRPEILLQQIRETQNAGVQGICFFEYNSVRRMHIPALKKGPFRTTASEIRN